MTVVEGLAGLTGRDRPCAVSVGTFDGVHLGHRALIQRAVSDGRERGIEAAVITWDRHPAAVLRPERVPPMITSVARKLELLEATGADLVVVLPFDTDFAQWPPERFARDVLAGALHARSVFVGRAWRFGHKAAGDVTLLTELGASLGFDVTGVELEQSGSAPVSSSRVRKLVAAGDVEEAATLLGRRFDFDGIVQRGEDRGKSLGFPTANVPLAPGLVAPGRGVYAGRARVGGPDGSWFTAAVNVGVNPTFGGDPETTPPLIEAYLLDFDDDLYGSVLRVEFWARLRDEERFDSVDALIAQMEADVVRTRSIVGNGS